MFLLIFSHLGRICSTLLDRTKTWNYLSLDKVVTLITKLIDDPELTCVIDAGKLSMYCLSRDLFDYSRNKCFI